MTTQLAISFFESTPAEGNELAIDLQNHLYQNASINTLITKDRSDTMDFGTSLAVILGTTSMVALAKGLANWLQLNQTRRLVIRKNGEVIGENLSSKDILAILTHLKDK